MKTPETGKDINVLRKTPEEIKMGLDLCSHEGHGEEIICNRCSYDYNASPFLECARHLAKDALAYIKKLESRLDQAEQKKDAALNAIRDVCSFCKGKAFDVSGGYPPDCELCMLKSYCPENTKEADSGGETTSASDA